MGYKVVLGVFILMFFSCKKERDVSAGCRNPNNLHFLAVYNEQGAELTGWLKVYVNLSEEVLTDTTQEDFLHQILKINLDPNFQKVNEIQLSSGEFSFQLYDNFSKKKQRIIYKVRKCGSISLYW
jgi:hypothetical protein